MPRRTRRALLVLLTGMAAGLLMTACGDGTAPALNDPRTFTGALTEYHGEPGVLRATAQVFDGTFGGERVIGRGTLDAEGRFDFAFDATVDPDALTDLRSDTVFCADVSVSAAARGGMVSTLGLQTLGGTKLGRIGLASSAEAMDAFQAGDPQEGRFIVRFYADAPVTIEGACTQTRVTYALALDAGWNRVDMRATSDGVQLRTLDTAPPDARWWYRPHAGALRRAGDVNVTARLPWLR